MLLADREPPDAGATQAQPPGQRAVPVLTERAVTADVAVTLSGLGTVTPLRTVTVRSQVSGQLLRVAFQEGQTVKEGQLLAEIDPRPFEVQLMQAQGQLRRDEALLKNAQADLKRYQILGARRSIAEQQVVTQDSLVSQYAGAVESDRAQIANAKLQLTYARITAPVSGRIGLLLVDPGNYVEAGDARGLFVITQMQPTTVVFSLPEDDLPTVMRRFDTREPLATDAYDRAGQTKLASGRLLAVDNQIDPATGTVKLKAEFDNEDQALFPNQFVNIRMTVDTVRGAVTIPAVAVQRGTPGVFVYVVQDDNTARVRQVELGPAAGDRVAIGAGLKAGEAIVIDGTDKLRDGTLVETHVNRESVSVAKEFIRDAGP
jgi:multidrug efflux system membrane fusion protein